MGDITDSLLTGSMKAVQHHQGGFLRMILACFEQS